MKATTTARIALPALLIGLIPQGLTEAAVMGSLPDMAKDLGVAGEFSAMMVLGTAALGFVIGALFSGKVLQMAGTRTTMLAAMIGYGLFGAVPIFIQFVPLLFVSRIIVGFSASCVATAALWGINHEIADAQRPRIFGLQGAVAAICTLPMIVLGGYITQNFGWKACFAIYPVVAAIGLVIVFSGVGQLKPEGSAPGEKGKLGKLVPLLALTMFTFGMIGVVSMLLGFLLDAAGQKEAGMRAILLAIPPAAAIAGAGSFNRLHARLGERGTLIGGLVSLAIGHVLVSGLLGGVVSISLGAAAAGLAMGLSGPFFYHAVSARVDVGEAGRYLGYLNASTFFGVFLSPLVAVPLQAQLGPTGLFPATATGITLVAAFAVPKLKAS